MSDFSFIASENIDGAEGLDGSDYLKYQQASGEHLEVSCALDAGINTGGRF
jgi:hypothetical protein